MIPLTDQVTAELGAPSTLAKNGCTLPKRTIAVPGDVATSTGIFSWPLVHPVSATKTKQGKANPARLALAIALSQVSSCTHLRPNSSAPIPAEEWESSGSGTTPTAEILYTRPRESREVRDFAQELCRFGTVEFRLAHKSRLIAVFFGFKSSQERAPTARRPPARGNAPGMWSRRGSAPPGRRIPAPLQGAPIDSECQGVALGWNTEALSAPGSTP